MSKPALRWFLFVLFVPALSVGTRAQQQDPAATPSAPNRTTQTESQPPDAPIFRTGINFIQVDAIVTDDDGIPVRDLRAADFAVLEDGEPQTVESFELVDIRGGPTTVADSVRPIITPDDEARAASRVDTRIIVIFFDDYHVRWENGVRAGRTLAAVLRSQLYPTDLVGIMHPLTPLAAVQLTRNHDAIIDAVESFAGRKYNYESLNEFEQRYVRYPTAIVERVRTEASLSALEGLMVHMGGLREGRKNVLLISEGFSNYVPPELRRGSEEPLAERGLLIIPDSRIEQEMQRQSDHALSFDLERVFSAANRFNTTIYAFDPRGATVFEYDLAQAAVDPSTDRRVLRSTRDTLQILALETDGHAITDTRPVGPGLEQMLRDASTYYLLGYTSSHSATDGRYHEITVRVKRDGLNVRHRKGFWALTEREAERALGSTVDEPPKAVDIAIAALAAPRQGRRLVRTWVGAARGEDGTSRVTFVWEPMSDRPSRGETPAGVLLTAMSETGGTPYRGVCPSGGHLRVGGRGPATRRDLGRRGWNSQRNRVRCS